VADEILCRAEAAARLLTHALRGEIDPRQAAFAAVGHLTHIKLLTRALDLPRWPA
jgi:hypothetical protein